MKKLISAFLLFMIFIMPVTVKADTKSYDINKLVEKVVIAENGDVYVEEELSYSFKGDFNGVYRNLLKKGAEGYSISEVLIRDKNDKVIPMEQSSSSNNNTYEITNTGSECKIKLFSKSSNENKTFIIRYTIHGVVVKTDNSGELYWSFYTVENDVPVNDFELNLSLKNADFNPNVTKHWAYVDGRDLKDSYDTKGIHVAGRDLTGVLGVRVVFQPDYLQIPIVNMGSSESFPRQSSNYNFRGEINSFQENRNRGVDGGFLVAGGIIFAIAIIVYLIKANERHQAAVDAYRAQAMHFSGDMLNTPPNDLSPALVELLINEKYISTTAVSATLYYLSSKGYYCLEKGNYKKSRLFSSEEKEDLIFRRKYEKMMPESPHLQYLIDWMSKYEEEGVFTLGYIEEEVGTSRGAMDFRDSLSNWEDIVYQEARNLGFYITIENRQILSNNYYDEQLKWIAYKRYLLGHIDNNQDLKPISNIDEALIYAPVLGIGTGGLEDLLKRVKHQEYGTHHSYNYDSYNYMPFFIANYYLWNRINDNMYQDNSSSINNGSFTGGDDSGFGGFSDGGGFSGGGGGDSGAF